MAERSKADDGEEERGSAISLGDVVSAARRRSKLIGSIALVLTTVAAVVIWLLPNRYEAVATVQIDQRNKEIVNIKGVISDLKADAATVDSEVEVIRSKQITHRVIAEMGLGEDAEFVGQSRLQAILMQFGLASGGFKKQPKAPASIADLIDPAGHPERDEIGRAFDQRLKVNRVRNTLVLEIHYSSADPVKAARIANAIAETYIKMQIEQKSKAMVDASSRLGDAMRGVREKVAVAERAIERFKSQNDIFDADGHLLVDRQLAREMEALVLARNRTFAAKSRYDQARRMMVDGEGNESLADVLQSNTVRLLRDEYTKALRRQAEAGTKYGPKHPEMQKIGADVAKAQSELGVEVNKIIKNLKTEYEVAVDGERQQEVRLEQLKVQIASSRETQWQLRELEREATASKQLYETLLTRNKQTVETQGLQFADARVVELADVPLFPMAPKRKQLAAISTVASFVLALAVGLFLELGTGSFARPRDIETVLDLKHLGSLPGTETPHALTADPMRVMRMVLAEPRGLFAEAMRGIRHELDNRIGRMQRRVILVASSLPNEGRSVVASNLALHYAAGSARTLLIDMDMRSGGLSRDLGVAEQAGLIDVLAGGVPVMDAILHDRSTGLHVLTAARRPDFMVDAASLLESHQFIRVLDQLRGAFDIVIIDAPPLLPVVDARIVASHVEAIVFVTAWRRTPRQLAKEALKCLGSDAGKVVGAVVNQVDYAIMAEDWGAIGRPYLDGAVVASIPRRQAA